MVPRTKLALAFLILLAGCRSQDAALVSGIRVQLTKEKLSNGLTLLMVENHQVPLISYQSWFRVGTVDEAPGYVGISHFFEHLMFKGTPKFGPGAFFSELEMKGAELNAFTTRDYTTYYQNFSPKLLEKVVEMESDRLQNLLINEENLRVERNVVLEERRLKTDNSPAGRMQEALWGLAYTAHPYEWPVAGIPEDLMTINVSVLTRFFKKYYTPSNLVISVVGDFDTSRLTQLVKKYYGVIPKVPRPSRKYPAEPEQRGERRLEITDHIQSPKLMYGYHISSADSDDSYSVDVLSNILFYGESSRAHRKLVEQKNWLFGVGGSSFTPTDPGLLMITADVRPGVSVVGVEEELSRLIHEVRSVAVSDEEISSAVKQLTVQIVDSVRTPYGLANLLGLVETVLGRAEAYATDLKKYGAVTSKSIRQVAEKYLDPSNRSVVLLLPKKKEGE